MKKKIPLIRPYITQEVKDKVCEVLDSGYLTEGTVTRDLEKAFSNYIGCAHAIATTSCTTGLEMALRALGVGPGDEVIVPDYTYPATADVVAIVGAKGVIVDVNKETMLIGYEALEQAITSKTKAVIPVSLFGNPLDYDCLFGIKDKYGLYIVEDAACSMGAEYNSIKVGNLADVSVFSMHPRKFITTGEGGMITTNNPEWARWINAYKHFGMTAEAWRESSHFDRIGTNYKLSNVLSAIGLVQMRHMDDLLRRRMELADKYTQLLMNTNGVGIPKTTDLGKHSRQSFCIYVEHRDKVMGRMRNMGIEAQIGTYAIHMQRAFSESSKFVIRGNLEGSRHAYEHCLTLPLYHEMTRHDQADVVSAVAKAIGEEHRLN